jgi:hypothetical protein
VTRPARVAVVIGLAVLLAGATRRTLRLRRATTTQEVSPDPWVPLPKP